MSLHWVCNMKSKVLTKTPPLAKLGCAQVVSMDKTSINKRYENGKIKKKEVFESGNLFLEKKKKTLHFLLFSLC